MSVVGKSLVASRSFAQGGTRTLAPATQVLIVTKHPSNSCDDYSSKHHFILKSTLSEGIRGKIRSILGKAHRKSSAMSLDYTYVAAESQTKRIKLYRFSGDALMNGRSVRFQ